MSKFDVVLVTLADVHQDARTLNLARALASQFSVAVIGLGTENLNVNLPFSLFLTEVTGSASMKVIALRRFARSLTNLTGRVVGTMDLFAGPAALVVKKRSSCALVYDAREFYFSLATLRNKPIRQFVISLYERFLLRRSKVVTVSAPLDATVVRDHYNLERLPTVILNSPPFRKPVHSTLLRDTFSIPENQTILLYQGVLHRGRGIEPILRCLKLVPNVAFCVIGDGPAANYLTNLAEYLGVSERVYWKGAIPYDQLHEWTCSADIGACLIEPLTRSYEYALPNKLFEYMMAGIPSIVTNLPALHNHITTYPCGILVDRELKEGQIAEAIETLGNPNTYAALKDQCKYIEDLSYERQQSVVLSTYYEAML